MLHSSTGQSLGMNATITVRNSVYHRHIGGIKVQKTRRVKQPKGRSLIRTLITTALLCGLATGTHALTRICTDPANERQYEEGAKYVLNTSHYGAESGAQTANGESFNPGGLTAASRVLPFGSLIEVTGPRGTVVLRINDYGPSAKKHPDRDLDITTGAAHKIGHSGVNYLDVVVLEMSDASCREKLGP